MALTQEQKDMCAAWCKSHYWQIYDRTRWRYQFHEQTLVRYYEEANLGTEILEPLLEYLNLDEARASGVFTLNNKPYDASGFKSQKAWYETRDGQVRGDTKLKVTRVFQALFTEPTSGEAIVVEDGCRWKVTNTYYWRRGELPTLPASSSGVQYTMNSVRRDEETGLYSCVVEKREHVQQDIAQYDQAKTIYLHTDAEQHLGVKADDVATTGQQASVGGGVMVERVLKKNEDCTTDIENVIKAEQGVSSSMAETRKTLDGIIVVTENRNQASAASASAMGIGGVVRNEKTPGGLYDQHIQTVDITPIGDKGSLCEKTALVHTHSKLVNQAEAPSEEHVPACAYGVITQVKDSVTQYGTHDVTTETRTAIAQSYTKTWTDSKGANALLVYRNQLSPLSVSGYDRVSNSYAINEFGLYDGSSHGYQIDDGSSTGSAIYSKSGTKKVIKRYQHAGGKIFKRTYTIPYLIKAEPAGLADADLTAGTFVTGGQRYSVQDHVDLGLRSGHGGGATGIVRLVMYGDASVSEEVEQ